MKKILSNLKRIVHDHELLQSNPTSNPQNQKKEKRTTLEPSVTDNCGLKLVLLDPKLALSIAVVRNIWSV